VKHRVTTEPWINTLTEDKGAPVGLKFGRNTGKKMDVVFSELLETQD